MKKKKDYQKVLDSYGIKYRKGSPKEVDKSIENMDMIFKSLFTNESVARCPLIFQDR